MLQSSHVACEIHVRGGTVQQSVAAVAELTGHQTCGRGKSIVVIGWPGNIRDLTDGLADFAPPGSQV